MIKPASHNVYNVEVPVGTPSGTLFACVTKTYGEKLKSKVTGKLIDLEDCARGYWTAQHLSAADAESCEWLMAHHHGKVCGIWKIDLKKGWVGQAQSPKRSWPEDQPEEPPHRFACELLPVSRETWDRFVGKAVRLGRAFGSVRGYFN